MTRIDILGVGVDPLTVEDLHPGIKNLIAQQGCSPVLNVNAHCMNLLYRDERLRRFFERAPIVFCDGAGVMLAARLLGRERIPIRITYADWVWQLAAFADAEDFSMFLLGARPSVAEKAARKLKNRYPGLKIVGVRDGYFDHRKGSLENASVVAEVNAAGPDILLLGLGMPLQERWLMENHERLNARVALTGGAVLDYVSGEARRGSRTLTQNGFEWLARLLEEPDRLWRRYLIGNPLFILRVLLQRLREETRSRRVR